MCVEHGWSVVEWGQIQISICGPYSASQPRCTAADLLFYGNDSETVVGSAYGGNQDGIGCDMELE